MTAPIPHSRPTLPSPEEWEEVYSKLEPGWVADGPLTHRFEAEAARALGCTAGAAANSGTSALHLALAALGVGPGSEVLLPAYCCAALLHAVSLTGGEPVLVDSVPGGANLCPADAARKRTPRTAAVIVAHMFGQPAPVAPFRELGVPVIEDCAQSLGASADGVRSGGSGSVAVCSFFATKVITTGHGGIAATSDTDLAGRLRDLLQYDNRDDWLPRFNYRVSEMQAALGLWQLERLDGFLRRREELRRYYEAELGHWLAPLPRGAIAYRCVLRALDAERAIGRLMESGVSARRPVYRPLHHYLGGDSPHAQAAHDRLVSIPIYPTLTDAESQRVATAVRAAEDEWLPALKEP